MSDTNGSLRGRTALITGAGGDIGRSVALRLAEAGASVILADREPALDRLRRTAALVKDQTPTAEQTLAVFDVTRAAEVGTALGDYVEPAELLFNNAGIQGAFANTLDAPLDDVDKILEVNVLGALCVLQVFARALTSTGRPGAIVNTASMAGVSGAPNMVGYSASKAAVLGMTKAAAKDLAPHNIRVNAISPGFIGPGAMWSNQVAEQARVPSPYYADDAPTAEGQMIDQIPLRRYGSLDEVAATVKFLLSDEASYLTGINIEISGGAH